MKLNPPASSSDLEAARAIARRLHQRAFASKTGAAPDPRPEPPRESPPVRRPAPPPLPTRSAPPPVVRPAPPSEPELRFASPSPPPAAEERPWSEPPPRRAAWTEEPDSTAPDERERHGHERWPDSPRQSRASEPALEDDLEHEVELDAPAMARPGASAAAGDVDDDALAGLAGGAPGSDLEDLTAGEPSFEDDRAGGAGPPFEEPEIEEPSFDEPDTDEPSFGTAGPAEPSFDEPQIEEPSFEGVGEALDDGTEREEPAPPSAYEPQVYEEASFGESVSSPAEVSPEDLIGSPTGSPDPWAEEPGLEPELGAPGAAEDLVEVATPSWDDVADACLAHAGARGAMLVAASGEVLSARGDWPNPGPEAIAGRLVAMMERALRDAPTRSVSAPLAGQHLTAWRVPVADGLLTAVFIGDSPLKADVRPGIDDEIRRAGGL